MWAVPYRLAWFTINCRPTDRAVNYIAAAVQRKSCTVGAAFGYSIYWQYALQLGLLLACDEYKQRKSNAGLKGF